MTDIPEIRAAFLESWERNGNDPTKGESVFNSALAKYRIDAQKQQREVDQKASDEYMQKLAHRVMDVFENADDEDTADDVMPQVFAAIGLAEAFGAS